MKFTACDLILPWKGRFIRVYERVSTPATKRARYVGTTPGIWLRLQARYDLEAAQAKVDKIIRREVNELRRPVAATQPTVAGTLWGRFPYRTQVD